MDSDSAKFITVLLVIFIIAVAIVILALQYSSSFFGTIDRAKGVTGQLVLPWAWLPGS